MFKGVPLNTKYLLLPFWIMIKMNLPRQVGAPYLWARPVFWQGHLKTGLILNFLAHVDVLT